MSSREQGEVFEVGGVVGVECMFLESSIVADRSVKEMPLQALTVESPPCEDIYSPLGWAGSASDPVARTDEENRTAGLVFDRYISAEGMFVKEMVEPAVVYEDSGVRVWWASTGTGEGSLRHYSLV